MKLLVLILIFTFSNSFAQNSYIVDKKGNKILTRDEVTDILLVDKRISYVNLGKSWEKYIKFEDLDHAVIGSSLLKSFHLNQKKKADVYFVYGEKNDRKLVGLAYIIETIQGHYVEGFKKTFYELYLIDNNETVLDQINGTSTNTEGKIALRGEISPFIKKYFSDCPALMTKLSKYDLHDQNNREILSFFFDTEYIKCQ
ncbi:hypothetical protein [Flavobacterium sp. N502540]|uniref:hypothetical protein n=1 Tax=Flavobacterium sp. N502540 TaxID=2986838 RepID=UPI00222428B8|nr:hypothetical protein [Flavobacterium sp. N502540]